MRAPLVTILYSPAGHGHRSAARSIADAVRRIRPDVEVEVVDVLRFAPRAFRYDLAWRLIQRHGGRFWDWLFDLTNRPMPAAFNWCRERLNRRLLAPLAEELVRRQPDRIVCTHYLPAVTVAQLADVGRLHGRTSVVITDYLSHEAWTQPRVERYYVATDDVARALAERGIPTNAVEITGIPVAHEMSARGLPAAPLHLTGRLRVLFLAAGVPRSLLRDALAALATCRDLDLEIVAGGDPGLFRLLTEWVAEFGLAGTLHGFLPTLQPLMDHAQIVVTKAGGLVVSECLVRGRAMVLPWPAPGHERGNRAHALAIGAAVALDDPAQLGALIDRLAQEPSRLVEMGRAAGTAATRDAADHIARDLLFDLAEAPRIAAPPPVIRIAQGAAR